MKTVMTVSRVADSAVDTHAHPAVGHDQHNQARIRTAAAAAVMRATGVAWVNPTKTAVSVAPTAATGSHRPRPGRGGPAASGAVVGAVV